MVISVDECFACLAVLLVQDGQAEGVAAELLHNDSARSSSVAPSPKQRQID